MYKKTNPEKKKNNGSASKKKTTPNKKTTAAEVAKQRALKARRASEVDRVLSTIGSPSKKSKLSAAQIAKKKRVISSYVNANKRR